MFINGTRGCSVAWSITNGLGPLNPGSNPGSPIFTIKNPGIKIKISEEFSNANKKIWSPLWETTEN